MRPHEIAQMFSQIAHSYDRANHMLSFNRDRAWRRIVVQQAAPKPGERLLDLCTGTGDVAIEFAKACPKIEIVGLDLSQEMLRVAQKKLAQLSLDHRVQLVQGDALELPFAENSFEIVTIAFGLRNLPDRTRVLKEIHRVLSPGGRAFIVEFSLPQSSLVRLVYLPYLRYIVPIVGGMVSGSRAPYEYLRNSIEHFPDRAQILAELYEAGFRPVGYRDLTCGVATLYWGEKE